MVEELEIQKFSTVVVDKDLYDELRKFAYKHGYNPNRLGQRFIKFGMANFEAIKRSEFRTEQDQLEELVLKNIEVINELLRLLINKE